VTFNFAPWAIDGARGPAALARLSSYAGGGGQSGIIKPLDLRVTALAVPGQGLRVGAGGATILNGYLSNPDESYVVSNPSSHTVASSAMPGAQPGTRYYLVCVVIGDPEFNQTGHPFMPSTPLDPAVALDFEYVRMVVIPCVSTTKRFEDLGVNYPGYALARLEVPANTTTITNAMITDLRGLASPREHSELFVGRQVSSVGITTASSPGSAWINPFEVGPWIQIPRWATRMQILATIGSLGNSGDATGEIRVSVNGIAGASETYDIDGASERNMLIAAWDTGVAAWAGQSVQAILQARQLFDLPGYAFADNRTQIIFDVRFSESIL